MANDINLEDKNVSLDDLVFENRNHEYGAYDLRKSYRWMLTKSFLYGVLFFILAIGIPFIYLKVKAMSDEEQTNVNSKLINIVDDPIIEKPEEKKEEPKPTPPPPKEEKVEVIKDVVPEPKKEPKHEEPAATNDQKKDSNTGTAAQEGEKKKVDMPIVPQTPNPGTGNDPKPAAPVVDNSVHEGNVDVKADFPGGITAFTNKFRDSFDTSVIEGVEGVIKAEVTFVVEKDGSLTDVQVTGSNRDLNAEAARAIKSIRAKWSPAKQGGQPVRSRFRMPVAMQAPE